MAVANLSLIILRPTKIDPCHFLFRLKIAFAFLCYELKIKEGANGRVEGKSLCFVLGSDRITCSARSIGWLHRSCGFELPLPYFLCL